MAAKTTKKQPTFEDGLQRLEQMANAMEASDLPVEELLRLYEEGMALSGELAQKLDGMKAALREVKPGKDGKPEVAEGRLESQLDMAALLPREEA